MASTGVNVLRWSSLGLGIFYGIYHQSSIKSADKSAAAQQEFNRKEKLIADARAAYQQKTQPKSSSGSDVIENPEHPNFDLEKYLQKAEKQ